MSSGFFGAMGLLPGIALPRRDWRALAGPERTEHALPLLRPTGRAASAVHCQAGCGCAHEVVPSNPGAALGVCICEDAGGCPDIPLSVEDLQVLELDMEKTGREVARALNARSVQAELPRRGLWQVGTWSLEAVPILMSFAAERAVLSDVIADCAARLRSRFILLVSDKSALDARSREILAQTGSGVFELDNILRPSAAGRFQPMKAPEELFAAFTTEAAEPEDGGIRKAFALIQKLEARSPQKPPGLATVFKLYCVDELSALEIARRCGCSKTTVIERLGRIGRVTGLQPAALRRFSGHLDRVRPDGN